MKAKRRRVSVVLTPARENKKHAVSRAHYINDSELLTPLARRQIGPSLQLAPRRRAEVRIPTGHSTHSNSPEPSLRSAGAHTPPASPAADSNRTTATAYHVHTALPFRCTDLCEHLSSTSLNATYAQIQARPTPITHGNKIGLNHIAT